MRGAVEAQYTNTLNNLSWTLAEKGSFQIALHTCRHALGLRRRLGSRAPVALSLNTMGLIQIQCDQPHEAIENCERALRIFRELSLPRGVGLVCIALSEALRRKGWALGELVSPDEHSDLLRQARDRCLEAVDIFSRWVAERPRLIEALIEIGCTYRDWAAIRTEYGGTDLDREALAQKATDYLRRAIREGEGEAELLHQVLRAQVDLTWLYYYM
jgi:tetratricopeptide (TPR) repeat protein